MPQRTIDAAKRKADAERAALPKAAGALAAAKTGDEMEKVGELYFSAGDYANASAALQKAIAKGGLSDADSAQMLLGIALKRKGDKAGAQKAFDTGQGTEVRRDREALEDRRALILRARSMRRSWFENERARTQVRALLLWRCHVIYVDLHKQRFCQGVRSGSSPGERKGRHARPGEDPERTPDRTAPERILVKAREFARRM